MNLLCLLLFLFQIKDVFSNDLVHTNSVNVNWTSLTFLIPLDPSFNLVTKRPQVFSRRFSLRRVSIIIFITCGKNRAYFLNKESRLPRYYSSSKISNVLSKNCNWFSLTF